MKYADFFDPPDGEEMESTNRESDEDDKEMKDSEEELAEDDEALGNNNEHEVDVEAEERPISNFQKQQQKVKGIIYVNFSFVSFKGCLVGFS